MKRMVRFLVLNDDICELSSDAVIMPSLDRCIIMALHHTPDIQLLQPSSEEETTDNNSTIQIMLFTIDTAVKCLLCYYNN